MALNPDACGVIDPSIPQWKRELILRRRALGRTLQVGSSSVKLTCPAVVAVVRHPELSSGCENNSTNNQKCSPSVEDLPFNSLNQNREDFHPGTSSAGSVSNMRLLDASSEVDNLVINNGIDSKNKLSGVVTNNSDTSVNYSLIMGEDKSLNLKKKSASRPKLEKNNCSVTAKQRFFIEKVSSEGTNGKSSKDEDCHSDSSEELQYGPGIVNKLKTKYLSMTLREQKRNVRPSLANLRRAASLENMLEGDDNLNEQTKMITEVKVKTETSSLTDRSTQLKKTAGLSYNRGPRTLGNHRIETMKRAQSMDTLLKSEVRTTLKPIVNENIIIVEKENLETNNSTDSTTRLRRDVNTELPPPDLVKQTLKIFETSPKRKIKQAGQGNLAKLVAGFSNPPSQPNPSLSSRSIDRRKVNQNNKPILSPKPVLSPEKLRSTKMGSPKRIQSLANSVQTSKKLPVTSNVSRPVAINNDLRKPQLVMSEQSISEKKAVSSPKVLSPRSVSPIVTVVTHDHASLVPQPSSNVVHSLNLVANGEKEVPSVHSDESEEVDGVNESSKPVPETALENIRRGGVSMQFSFNSESPQSLTNKSYLPRSKSPPQALNTSLLNEKLEKSPLPTSFVSSRQQSPTQPKQVGIIRPLVSTKVQSSVTTPALTEQEIEKNLINRVKSIEQPISKVVVAIKALPDSVVLGSVSADVVSNKSLSLSQGCASSKVKNQGLWDEKIWHSNQNTIVFNFSNRKEVPDYIENDGLILRGKRDRPRPGDGGYILLDGAAGDDDETSTEAEDLLTSSPPSPCDVTFVGDNVVINGRSNLKRAPKQVKLRIQFNDEATTMFEYPSEASLTEEELTAEVGAGDPGCGGDAPAPPPRPACASAAPGPGPGLSMNLGTFPPDFLPPPAPDQPPPPPPVTRQSLSLPKAKAPPPPVGLAPVGPPIPPRSPPRLFKSNSVDVVSPTSRKTVSQTDLSSSAGGKEKYFSMKKVRKSKPSKETDSTDDTKVDFARSPATEIVTSTDVDNSVNVGNLMCDEIPSVCNPVNEVCLQAEIDVVSSSSIKAVPQTNMPSDVGGKEKYFSMKKVRKPKPRIDSESTFDTKVDSVQSVTTESEKLTDPDKSVNVHLLIETQVSNENPSVHNPVEESYQQPKVEVSSVSNASQIETHLLSIQTTSIADPDLNHNSLPDIKLSETNPDQSQLEETSLNQCEIGELDDFNVLNNNNVSDTQCQGGMTEQFHEKECKLSADTESDIISTFLVAHKNSNQSSDENGNDKTGSTELSSLKPVKVSGLNETKVLSTRPDLGLKSQSKPMKIVQPLMGTKSLPTTLLSNIDYAPKYLPVYSKPSLVCSNTDLAVDPVLSQVITQKKVPSPTFVNRSLSTSKVLVLDDWPLGTESLV